MGLVEEVEGGESYRLEMEEGKCGVGRKDRGGRICVNGWGGMGEGVVG